MYCRYMNDIFVVHKTLFSRRCPTNREVQQLKFRFRKSALFDNPGRIRLELGQKKNAIHHCMHINDLNTLKRDSDAPSRFRHMLMSQ